MANRLSGQPELGVRAGQLVLGQPAQFQIPCLFMRGGSSRGGFFLREDLPADERLRSALLLAAYGSPDTRQIDGIGGADPLTSKAAIVGCAKRQDADVDYTFCQVNVDRALVSTGGSCGNMLAGVGPFAVMQGLVAAVEPVTKVRIYTTNTRQVVTALVPVVDGVPAVDGDCSIAGVPGTGARIDLDFGDCAGAVSGKLLPTGKAVQTMELGGRTLRVSLVDAATPFIFVAAEDVGATGRETPEQLLAKPDLMQRLELVRGWAAVTLGLVPDANAAREVTPNIPRVMIVARPTDYVAVNGTAISAHDHDVLLRQLAMQRPHRALAVTGAVCAAVAAAVPGSLVATFKSPSEGEDIRIGHPSGVMRVGATVTADADGIRVSSARLERTARLIMAGTLYARRSAVERLMERVP